MLDLFIQTQKHLRLIENNSRNLLNKTYQAEA